MILKKGQLQAFKFHARLFDGKVLVSLLNLPKPFNALAP